MSRSERRDMEEACCISAYNGAGIPESRVSVHRVGVYIYHIGILDRGLSVVSNPGPVTAAESTNRSYLSPSTHCELKGSGV